MRRRSGATARRQRSEDFLFVKLADRGHTGSAGAESLSTLSSVSSSEVVSGFMVTSVGTMMALQAGAGSSAVMACIPFLPSWSQGSFSQDALSHAPGPVSQRLRLLSHLVNGAALAQLTTAMLQFALNDPLSGLIGGGIAAIGWQTAHPAGFRLLPTYVVLSFCHGIMQVLLNLQLLASGVPLKAMTAVQAGFMGKVAVGTLLASPLVMFLGMGTGYWLHKESQELLRSLEPAPSPPSPAMAPAVPANSPMAGTPAPASPTQTLPPVPPPVSPTTEVQDLRPPAPKKVFWKTELQQQRFSLARAMNPAYCYRGLPLAIASIAPITCIQFGANSLFSSTMKAAKGKAELNEFEKLLSAVLAGAASALVQCPCQLVEVNQSNHGSSMLATARRVVSQNGLLGLYRGYTMGATREGIFCSSYMAINPMVKGWIHERELELSDNSTTLLSSVVSGTLGAALSHPADTLKTRLQAGALPLRPGEPAEASRISGPIAALKDISEKGDLLKKCFAGFSPRLFRLICCTYIYSTCTESLEALWHSATVDLVVGGTRVQVTQSYNT